VTPGNWSPIPDPRRILLIQLGDIGDVVLTTPALKVLKRKFPGSAVIVALRDKASELLEDQPWVDGVIPVSNIPKPGSRSFTNRASLFLTLMRGRFDVAVDLRTGSRGMFIAVLSGAGHRIGRIASRKSFWRRKLFTHIVMPRPERELHEYAPRHNLNILEPLLGEPVEAPPPELAVSSLRLHEVRALTRAAGVPDGAQAVALHPFSLWPYKEWSPEKWKSVIEQLKERHRIPVIVTGAPEDRARATEMAGGFREGVFNLAGKTPLGLLPALFKMCRLVVGVDTAALHIAAAVKTPTVGIFGPSRAEVWAPKGPQHITMSSPSPCVPCAMKGCRDEGKSLCLEELEAEKVVAAVNRSLNN